MTRPVIFATGTSSGFSLTALAGALAHTDWVSVLSFAGSVVATALGWYLARRNELARARIELDHQARQAARDELIADALAELRVRTIRDATPTMPASDLGRPHSEGS